MIHGKPREFADAASSVWPDGLILDATFFRKLKEFGERVDFDTPVTWLASVVLKDKFLERYTDFDDKLWVELVNRPEVYDRTGPAKQIVVHQERCGRKLYSLLKAMAKPKPPCKPKKLPWWKRNRMQIRDRRRSERKRLHES